MDWNTILALMDVAIDCLRLLELVISIALCSTGVVALAMLIWEWLVAELRGQTAIKQGCPTVFTSKNANAGYTVVGACATGDLCDVNLVEDNRQQRYVMKTARSRSSNRWLRHEQQVLSRLDNATDGGFYRAYLPWLVEQKFVRGRCSNVFEFREGFMTADQILQFYPNGLDGRHLAWMYKRVLEGLGFIHANGWVHGAVLPQHMMFHVENHGLQLVGWCQSVPLGMRLRMVCRSMRNWYPPEALYRNPTTESTDIVLATRSMILLAGGNPAADWIPAHIPKPIGRFWKSCLYESPAMRPQDAWQLHEEFTDLLEVVYGPPQYHNLDLIKKGECNGFNSLV